MCSKIQTGTKNLKNYNYNYVQQLKVQTSTPRMGILNSVPPVEKFEPCAPGGKDGSHILFSPRSSGLIKMKANCAIKGKHVFMVMELESAVSPSLNINPDSSSLLNMVKAIKHDYHILSLFG